MCGILGIIINKNSTVRHTEFKKIFDSLLLLSVSRGKEASGFAIGNEKTIAYYKTPFAASQLVNSKTYETTFKELYNDKHEYLTAIGHSRLVTNGYEQNNINNQPVIKYNSVTLHNGIIVNAEDIWNKQNHEDKISELDSEVIPTLIAKYKREGKGIADSLRHVYREIYGMASIIYQDAQFDNIFLATNNGSLYYLVSVKHQILLFASELHFIKEILAKKFLLKMNGEFEVKHVNPGEAVSFNPYNSTIDKIALSDSYGISFNNLSPKEENKRKTIREIVSEDKRKNLYINKSMEYENVVIPSAFSEEVEKRIEQIANLKRCTKCILPETFPFIHFDANGVCNYCNNYKRIIFKGKEGLMQYVEQFKKSDSQYNCLVPFSGGRDSCYALHYIKTELNLKPIAFSYDWGMITDLARRNQSRLCGKLGVEHILISADIRKKRDNIRKNVLAWLKRPNMGTIPLFMAGDKQYFYYANQLMQTYNLELSVLGENLFETTNFKSGFCGIKPNFDKKNTYSLSLKNKTQMLLFYGKEYLINPAYLNSSLFDTFDAFKAYYILKHNNVNLYSYLEWKEDEIISTLKKEYDWEIDPWTTSTWRIGDGTAAFYNYIYYFVSGFTENDTFRSNQIREGQIDRATALKLARSENLPRWNSLNWYCSAIHIDLFYTLSIINRIPTLFRVLN